MEKDSIKPTQIIVQTLFFIWLNDKNTVKILGGG